jgi:hypothetical protein
MQTVNNINNINDKYTVVYSTRLEELNALWGDFTVEALDATDIFINGNYSNTRNKTATAFEKKFTYTDVNDDSSPVLVYLNGDTMVAWYDEELGEGYIA